MPEIGIPAVLSLDELDGRSVLHLLGTQAYDHHGVRLTGIGDVNADGYDDVIAGIDWTNDTDVLDGEAFIVYGSSARPDTIDLATITEATGVHITGIRGEAFLSEWLSGGENGGDVGTTSVLLGVNPNRGVYLLYGYEGMPGTIDVTELTGSAGKPILGFPNPGETAARNVALAGDLNGDNFADFIVGSPDEDPSRVFVIFAPQDFSGPSIDVSTLDGTNGFVINQVGDWDLLGTAVEAAGDVNGDGHADIILGAPNADGLGRADAGEAYVIFSTDGGWDPVFDLASLDGSNGFRIAGLAAGDGLGSSVASAGDLNGDGYDDIVVSAAYRDGGHGTAYVVFGKAGGFDATLDLATLDGSNGFRIEGDGLANNAGLDTAAIGDFDGDGIDDLAIGASGAAFVLLGQQSFHVPAIQLADLDGADRSSGLGFRIDGTSEAGPIGRDIAAAGDVNGDGFADIALSTSGDSTGEYGDAYILYGRLPATSVLRYGTGIGQTIHGSGGADTLFGRGGADILLGGNGGDYLHGDDGNDLVDGGNGRDYLYGGYGNDILHGGTGDDTLDGGFGTNALEGGDGNDAYVIGYGTDIVVDSGGLYDSLTSHRSFDLDEFAGSGIEYFTLDRDNIRGGSVSGTDGNDNIGAHGSLVTIDAGAGDDQLTGSDGSSEIFIGGLGHDVMSSGPKDFSDPWFGQMSGRDTFVFRDIADSTVGAGRDVIDWFLSGGNGDWIDLRQIDADVTRRGNQAFHLIDGDFTGAAGELRVAFTGPADPTEHIVSGDIDGDGLADFEIEVHTQGNNAPFLAVDFLL